MAAYAVPAALAWALLGLLLNFLPLSRAALLLAVVYCVFYGVPEALGRAGPAPPGSRWQVPQRMVSGVSPRRRILVWGAVLGPGFATRNPYAGFGLLLLMVAALGSVTTGVAVAAAIGIAHGTGRALAVVRDSRQIGATEYLRTLLKSMYWRTFDGLALLVIGGVAASAYISTFWHVRL